MAPWEDAWGNVSDVKILHMITISVLFFLFCNETTSQPSFISALQYRSIQPLASLGRSENNRQQTFVLSLKQFVIFSRPRLGDMGASTGERNGIHNYSTSHWILENSWSLLGARGINLMCLRIILLNSIYCESYYSDYCTMNICKIMSLGYHESIIWNGPLVICWKQLGLCFTVTQNKSRKILVSPV